MVQRSVRGAEAGFNYGLSTDCFYTDDEPTPRAPPEWIILHWLSVRESGWEPACCVAFRAEKWRILKRAATFG